MYKKILFIFLILFIIFSLSPVMAFGDPKLVTKLNSAFSDIEKWLIKLATPAAAVAVGTGVFMKKFSFGDEEKALYFHMLLFLPLILFYLLLRALLVRS